jgi:hypothetical protein
MRLRIGERREASLALELGNIWRLRSPERLWKLKQELPGWELYQVQVDKYHVMFWFENGHCLLNVAFRFSFRSSDRSIEYVYDVQAPGDRKLLTVDSILRRTIRAVEALDERQLSLTFDNGNTLVVHDSPEERSAWFYRYDPKNQSGPLLWAVDDEEPY